MYLPVRHGEGKFVAKDDATLDRIINDKQVALKYFNPDSVNDAGYPFNPNGSTADIAGILNKNGNVFGLMPHPEAYIFRENHPRWTEFSKEIKNELTGLKIFQNGINYFKKF